MSHAKRRIVLPSMTPGCGRSLAVHRLLPMLVQADRRGRIKGEIVAVPIVNPIGLSQRVGNDHLGRDNFNRNWHDLSAAVAQRVEARLGSAAGENMAAIRAAAVAALAGMKPVNELQTLRVEVLKPSIDADIVLDLHGDQEAVLHLFLSRQDWPGAVAFRIAGAELLAHRRGVSGLDD